MCAPPSLRLWPDLVGVGLLNRSGLDRSTNRIVGPLCRAYSPSSSYRLRLGGACRIGPLGGVLRRSDGRLVEVADETKPFEEA